MPAASLCPAWARCRVLSGGRDAPVLPVVAAGCSTVAGGSAARGASGRISAMVPGRVTAGSGVSLLSGFHCELRIPRGLSLVSVL